MFSTINKIPNLVGVFTGLKEKGSNYDLTGIDRAPGSGNRNDSTAHHQGIFKLDENQNYIVTGSIKNTDKNSEDRPYFYVVKDGKGAKCADGKDYFIISHDENPLGIDPSDRRRFTHPGGIQVAENILAVGIEDYHSSNVEVKKDRSIIRFYDISNELAIKEITGWSFYRSGPGQMASAVGLTKVNKQWLLAVRADGYFNFYVSNNTTVGEEAFRPIGRIDKVPDGKNKMVNVPSFQNINLYLDDKNEVYLFGMGSDEDHDKCHLYKLHTTVTEVDVIEKVKEVEYLSTKHFKREHKGPRFKYASCVTFDNNKKISVHSASMHVLNNKITCCKWE